MTGWPQMPGVQITGTFKPGFETILTPEALAFVVELERRFGPERKKLLQKRIERQARLDAGEKPDFLPEDKHIREGDRSEEHTYELQSQMRTSYCVFCLKRNIT